MADDSELSQDEINDLLGSIEDDAGGDVDAERAENGPGEDKSPVIKILDLHRPDIFTQDGVRKMNAYVLRWGEAIANAIRVRFGTESSVEAESLDLLTYDELIRTIPNPGIFLRVSGGFREQFLVEMTEPLSSKLIRLSLGYPLSGALAPLETVHRRIGGSILSAVARHAIAVDLFRGRGRATEQIIEDPALIALTDPYEMVVVVALSVSINDGAGQVTEGRINLSIPSFVVDRLVEESGCSAEDRVEQPAGADAITYRGKLEFPLSGIPFRDVDTLIANGTCPIRVPDTVGTLRFSTPAEEMHHEI